MTAVEIKDIDLPHEMQRAMARQAEAERERRAKVIAAEGELQASEKLTEAARVLQQQPAALQLRYLQTVAEIATENNSTTLFPIPIDLFRPFIERAAGMGSSASADAAQQAALPLPRIDSAPSPAAGRSTEAAPAELSGPDEPAAGSHG